MPPVLIVPLRFFILPFCQVFVQVMAGPQNRRSLFRPLKNLYAAIERASPGGSAITMHTRMPRRNTSDRDSISALAEQSDSIYRVRLDRQLASSFRLPAFGERRALQGDACHPISPSRRLSSLQLKFHDRSPLSTDRTLETPDRCKGCRLVS